MKISIVVATYNASKTLSRCLKSVTTQLNSSCELIIIDGNSTDDTHQIIKDNQSFISYFISEPDKGIYDAWNKGIRVAQGDWIMFIGADDILLTGALNKYIQLLNKEDLSDYHYISAHNEYVDHNGRLLKLLGNGASWKQMRRGMSAAHVASLHSKKLFEAVGHYSLDFSICADYELLVRLKDQLKSYFLKESIARMQVGGMSFTVKAIVESFQIRKSHMSVPNYLNCFLFLRDVFAHKMFRLRKRV